SQRIERCLAPRVALAPRLDAGLVRKTRGALLDQCVEIKSPSAEIVLLVFAIGLCSKIPLLRRRRQQRPVRRSNTQYDFCHKFKSALRPPSREAALQSLSDPREQDSRECDDNHSHE